MRKQRGSAMIFAVVLVVSMTTAVVATVYLTSTVARDERIYEDQIRMRYAMEGATDQIVQDYSAGSLTTFPSTRTVTVFGVTGTYTITDNSANIPHTMQVVGTISYHGRTITETKVVGMRKTPSPFYYALFVNTGGVTYSGNLTTGSSSANGDVYFGGNLTLTGTSTTINGNLESAGTLTPGSATVTGTQYSSSPAITFPTVSAANYSSVANQTITKGNITNFTFTAMSPNYYLVYVNESSVSISGTMSGNGTIFVNGNATISGNITYANSSSRFAVIATGSITFSTAGPNQGYFYANSISLPSGGMTLSKGALVCNTLSTTTAALTATNDNDLWLTPTDGRKYWLPGFYP